MGNYILVTVFHGGRKIVSDFHIRANAIGACMNIICKSIVQHRFVYDLHKNEFIADAITGEVKNAD